MLAQEGRVADIIVLGGLPPAGEDAMLRTAEYVLLNAGRPVSAGATAPRTAAWRARRDRMGWKP
ncbi:hypothetical protein ACTMU2_41015 [Cupriavidus basilensis]